MSIRAALIFLVLVAADVSAQTWIESSDGEWEPDQSMLEDAMSKLSESFSAAPNHRFTAVPPWESYQLKYRGYVEDGERLLSVSGTCDEYNRPEFEGEEIILVADGGPCHFDAIYDPSDKKVVYFFIHGYA